MSAILAIDAAWTPNQPSGISVVVLDGDRWRCRAAVPSYASLLAVADGSGVDWSRARFPGTVPDVTALLAAGERIAGRPIDLVTVDMPMSTVPIDGRREADNAISRAFGRRGCGTHSPNATRPGPLGAALTRDFADAGFPIATASTACGTRQRAMEVYPHPALLALLGRDARVPYKVAKVRRYWPNKSRDQRRCLLLDEFTKILAALRTAISDINLALPEPSTVAAFSSLKRYEDALDGLICAWVGMRYLAGEAHAYGDTTAAIWCPPGLSAATHRDQVPSSPETGR